MRRGEALLVREGERRPRSRYDIRRVAVLGAGTMGARIAAHIANAGLPVLLLDMVTATGERNALAAQAMMTLKTAKPAAFASTAAAGLITIGNFADDRDKLKDCDWIVEAVVEDLEIKRALLKKVVAHLHANAILTTNTSGLPVARIAEELPADVRARWFGAHFFNPPRYMRLLEIIATPETDVEAVAAISDFGDRRLGKVAVRANDVPNFIANRVGTFAMLNVFKVMKEQGLTIEEVDLLTGEVVGWPKTGTFRLSDLVGLDVLASVARNFAAGASDERPDVVLPDVIARMMEQKWLGDKAGQGFYKKARGADGADVRSVLDLKTLEYRPAGKVSLPALDAMRKEESLAVRLNALLAGEPATGGSANDRAAAFYWRVLPELWTYAADRIGEVSESLVEIDRAMCAGFNWTLGPFEMWDAAGVSRVVEKMRLAAMPVPAAVEQLLEAGGTSWYRDGGAEFFDVQSGSYQPVKRNPELASIASYRRTNGVFAGNDAISLVDIGEGIGCFELHSKMNSIGDETVRFFLDQLSSGSEAVRNFDGFVLATDAQNFSVGANLKQLLAAMQENKWDDVGMMVAQFQAMTQAVKFCARPVVVAAAGMCLGGGCEIALHGAARQPHLELYTGLVETGVGLIPGGGGCKEMVLRALADAGKVRVDARGESVEIVETIKAAFETIAMAKVSGSAAEAKSLRLLADSDAVSMNRSRLLGDAKEVALRLTRGGYISPAMRTDIPAPGSSVMATLKLGIYLMHEGAYISEHDAKVAAHVAHILTGGGVTAGTLVSEQYLLELEAEAFLSLCGEAKTMERVAFTLKTGKPLRN